MQLAPLQEALKIGAANYDAIKLILEHSREKTCGYFNLDGHPHLKSVTVENIDLASYGELVSCETAEV